MRTTRGPGATGPAIRTGSTTTGPTGAEHDWLYQRRNGYADIYDPWSPEEVEQRRQSRIEREEEALRPRADEDDDWTGPAGKKRTKKKKKKGRKSRTGNGPDRQGEDWFDSVEFEPGP